MLPHYFAIDKVIAVSLVYYFFGTQCRSPLTEYFLILQCLSNLICCFTVLRMNEDLCFPEPTGHHHSASLTVLAVKFVCANTNLLTYLIRLGTCTKRQTP